MPPAYPAIKEWWINGQGEGGGGRVGWIGFFSRHACEGVSAGYQTRQTGCPGAASRDQGYLAPGHRPGAQRGTASSLPLVAIVQLPRELAVPDSLPREPVPFPAYVEGWTVAVKLGVVDLKRAPHR